MTKRDDDSQADMEVGMTTAERRRRRRRGAGLRVPSDNVPRRSSTPPVVAPVPEDPALAMSIAYSFGSSPEPAEPVSRGAHEAGVPSFENHEGMPTVIDPVSGPIDQADFEMKTREMTAVDLEELGLTELAGSTMPFPRVSSPGMEPAPAISPEMPGIAVRFARRPATEPEEEVEVDLDTNLEGVVDGGTTLDQEPRGIDLGDSEVDLDAAEPTQIHRGPPPPPEGAARSSEASSPRPVFAEISRPIAMPAMPPAIPTQALNEGSPPRPIGADGSQPRPAIPTQALNDGPPPRPVVTESSPPRLGAPATPGTSEARPPMPAMPSAPGASEGPPRPAMPATSEGVQRSAVGAGSSPPVVPTGYRTGRAQTVALSEDDLEEVREAARQAIQPPMPPPRPQSTSIPPPMPPMPPMKPADARPRPVEPALPSLVGEIDFTGFDDKVAESTGEFEVDVDGIVESKLDEPAHPIAPPPGPLASPSLGPPAPPLGPPAPLLVPHVAPVPPPSFHPTSIPASPPSIPPPGPGHAASMSSPSLSPPRDSQPIAIARDAHGPPPPPPAAVHRTPPSPPPSARRDKSSPALTSPLTPVAPPPGPAPAPAPGPSLAKPDVREPKADGKPPRTKPWFVELFDEDYLRTLPFLTPQATQAEAEFVINAMGLTPGAQVLDIGCGYGRHAMELAARGFHVVGLDLSTPLLVRGGEEAHRRGLTINFVRGDMRELDFDAQFDGAYCLFSTFGYFDDETNKKTIANFARALRPGGRVLIEILNRDYVISDLPTRVWWEGDGCVVLEEVELNYFSSRIQVNRSVVFDDGRQLEQDISVRAYSLHEVGKLLHSAGLRVLEVSGAYHTRGRFFGNQSRHIIVLAERKDPGAT